MFACSTTRPWSKSSQWKTSWRSCLPITKLPFRMGSMAYGKLFLLLIIFIYYFYLLILFIFCIYFLYLLILIIIFTNDSYSDTLSTVAPRARWAKTRTRSPVCSLVCRWKRVKGCALSMNAILPCLIMSMKWRVIEFINSIQYGIHTHSVAATVMHNENFCA